MSSQIYNLLKPGNFIDNLSLKKRLNMFELFMEKFPEGSWQNVLDVGVTADKAAISSNYFEKYYPFKEKIIALSNQDAAFLEEIYPGLTFKQGDAKQLPFADNSIDIVFSSAVIEHVGSSANQKKMLAECIRVAKKGVFITTPNRWHPIEVHTILPLIHWLPKHLHRKLLRLIGLKFYSQEENLNLLDSQTLSSFCHQLGATDFMIKSIKTSGFTSNLLLIIKK
jgi:ubiquinone/menaquinone biosynthesis C-methylase UbiE